VPYQSKDFLVVSAQGLKNGDPILLAGYPGRTSRYKLPEEIRFARDASYPARVAESRADIATIDAATAGNPNAGALCQRGQRHSERSEENPGLAGWLCA
jgi:hypothetical protein